MLVQRQTIFKAKEQELEKSAEVTCDTLPVNCCQSQMEKDIGLF